jgi:hypothetical protein
MTYQAYSLRNVRYVMNIPMNVCVGSTENDDERNGENEMKKIYDVGGNPRCS